MLGGSWIAMYMPAILATAELACQAQMDGGQWVSLTAAQAEDLEAIMAQIIPSDDSPGAREAGVVRFADLALDSFLARMKPAVIEGLTDINVRLSSAGNSVRFSELNNEDQISQMHQIDRTPFFGAVQFMTIAGFLSHPKHGGNRSEVGWEHIGFNDQHAWQPPFGYYDRPYHDGSYQEGGDDE